MLHTLMLKNTDIVKQKQKRNNPTQRQSLLASWCTFFPFFSFTNFIRVTEGKLEKSPSLFQIKMSHINDFELLVKYLEYILEQMFYIIWVNWISKRGSFRVMKKKLNENYE